MKFIKLNSPKIIKIQAFVRGMMIRKEFKDILLYIIIIYLFENYATRMRMMKSITNKMPFLLFLPVWLKHI